MNEIKQRKSLKIWQIIAMAIATFFMIAQMFNLSRVMYRSHIALLRFMPTIAQSATIILVMMVFGAVYSRKKVSLTEPFKFWVLGVASLWLLYLAYFIRVPSDFLIWKVWGMLLPITTSSSVLLAGLIFSLVVQPMLFDWLAKMTNRQATILLSFLTIGGFATSAGMLNDRYAITGVYLIIFFAWGMFLSRLHFTKKQLVLAALVGAFLLLFVSMGVPAFNAVYWAQLLSGRSVGEWNNEFLANVASPVMFLIAAVAFVLFKPVIVSLRSRQMRYFIPVIILMQAPMANAFGKSFRFTGSAAANKLILTLILSVLVAIISSLFERYLYRLKPVRLGLKFLGQPRRLTEVLELTVLKLWRWIKTNRINLLTWAWFYILSFASFVIEADNMRIQINTATTINAVVFLLATRFFAIVLTAIFLDAAFSVLYFLTTRYWTSNLIVTIITIVWAVSNKIKLQLRGEPIYPTELSEIVNWKTLLPMVGKNTLIIAGISILIVVVVVIFLELKLPVEKRGSWKRRGIWALLSLLLFMTPARFNHDSSWIHHLSHGFDNRQSFRNPERDIQINGPILNFLNYIDLQIMTRPNNYSQHTVADIAKKYTKVAAQINRTRHNDLSKQTVIFNLSESFVDPKTFPTIKINGSDPVKFIRSLKQKTTYGSMLSAGYGGGTANMEWENLTGLNMGLFSSTLTPYVQVVPKFKFYPTIGMNFTYKSAIHPFIGSYYSRIENYKRFKFNKFVYKGSNYKLVNQRTLGKSEYNSDFTTYDNGLHQINSRAGGQFINLISIQNHMPYNNWYPNNSYVGKVSGDLLSSAAEKLQFATYVKGTQYTDRAVKKFIASINRIKKPITIVFYGDHYPSIISQSYTSKYPIQMHSTRYFIYSNKYAREHGAKAKLTSKTNFVNSSDFIAMMLDQTNSKVTPYQALLTEIHRQLPAVTINYAGDKGFELVNNKGEAVPVKTLSSSQQALLKDYETIQYDMTTGKAYGLGLKNFYDPAK